MIGRSWHLFEYVRIQRLSPGASSLGSGERRPAVLVHRPIGIVRHFPGVAVGIDEDSRVSAPGGGFAGTGYGRPGLPCLGEHGVDLLRRADVERQRHSSPAAPVLDSAVPLELGAVPEREDEPACLEEGDVVGIVVDAPSNAPMRSSYGLHL